MNFEAFSKEEIAQYEAEVKERWGNTKAYAEYAKKAGNKNLQEQKDTADRLMELFAGLGALKELPPEAENVQAKIRELQQFITDNYYTCTDEILQGLGEMYVSDERMKRNIDKKGGCGTAEFVRKAISVYCVS